MLKGRLGLETSRVPHVDRHGLVWLSRGRLSAENGTLTFLTAGDGNLAAGAYDIPFQMLSCVMLGPGGAVTHDALRLLARHGVGLVATGTDGVRFYASMPFGPDASALARSQVRAWADPERRSLVARRMYALRMGEVFPDADIAVLRGMEGARVKETYRMTAHRFGLHWNGRRYDRADPDSNDPPNQALNHAASAVEAAALIAVAASGTIPQLGFIHEDSGHSWALDIADLYRDSFTIPVAFAAAAAALDGKEGGLFELERIVRRRAGAALRKQKVIPSMIDRIKELLRVDDGGGDA